MYKISYNNATIMWLLGQALSKKGVMQGGAPQLLSWFAGSIYIYI